jgi:hypothetical protein
MLPLFTDLTDPLLELRQFGIDAELAWAADFESNALIHIQAAQENLDRLERWLDSRPKWLVPYGIADTT